MLEIYIRRPGNFKAEKGHYSAEFVPTCMKVQEVIEQSVRRNVNVNSKEKVGLCFVGGRNGRRDGQKSGRMEAGTAKVLRCMFLVPPGD